MNKLEFITQLSNKTGLSFEDGTCVCDIFENYLFWSKKNRRCIIDDLVARLNITKDKANIIYQIAMEIIKDGLKKSIFNPFKSKD